MLLLAGDGPDPTDAAWQSALSDVQSAIGDDDPAGALGAIQAAVPDARAAQRGLLALALTDGPCAGEYWGLAAAGDVGVACEELRGLLQTRWAALKPALRAPALALADRVLRAEPRDADRLVVALLRCTCAAPEPEDGDRVRALLAALPAGWLAARPRAAAAAYYAFARRGAEGDGAFAAGLLEHAASCGRELVRCGGPLEPGRSPRSVVAARVSPAMEDALMHLLTQVTFGQQQRPQSAFFARFVAPVPAGAPRDALVADIVRWCCVAFHPGKALIRSEILPRWALIGFLLGKAGAEAHLALTLDYLVYQEGDSVMNLEPAALLMHQSIARFPDVTSALLRSLLVNAESGRFGAGARAAVGRALASVAAMGVISSTQALLAFPKLPPDLRERLPEVFPLAFGPGSPPPPSATPATPAASPPTGLSMLTSPEPPAAAAAAAEPVPDVDDPELARLVQAASQAAAAHDARLAGALGDLVTAPARAVARYCESAAAAAQQAEGPLGRALARLVARESAAPLRHSGPATAAVLGALSSARAGPLVVAMRASLPAVGARLLFVRLTRADSRGQHELEPYEAYLAASGGDPAARFVADMRAVVDLEARAGPGPSLESLELALQYIVPRVCRWLPALGRANAGLVEFFLRVAHPEAVRTLGDRLALGEFAFMAELAPQLAAASLGWDSLAQSWFWALAEAEASALGGASAVVLADAVEAALAAADPRAHHDAFANALRLLRRIEPQPALFARVAALPAECGKFAPCCLAHWAREFGDAFEAGCLALLPAAGDTLRNLELWAGMYGEARAFVEGRPGLAGGLGGLFPSGGMSVGGGGGSVGGGSERVAKRRRL